MSKPQSKTMRDAMGNDVPVQYVSKYDKINDKLVRRIHERFKKARAMLEKVMADSLTDLEAIQVNRAADGRPRAGEKGNLSSSSFDGLITVSCDVRYFVELDDRVITARDKMLDYVRGVIARSGSQEMSSILAIVEEGFRVNAAGALSMARITSLLRVKITAPEWLDARKLLIESMRGTRGKSYLRVEERPDRNHDKRLIKLDLADCWPMPEEEQ